MFFATSFRFRPFSCLTCRLFRAAIPECSQSCERTDYWGIDRKFERHLSRSRSIAIQWSNIHICIYTHTHIYMHLCSEIKHASMQTFGNASVNEVLFNHWCIDVSRTPQTQGFAKQQTHPQIGRESSQYYAHWLVIVICCTWLHFSMRCRAPAYKVVSIHFSQNSAKRQIKQCSIFPINNFVFG